MSTESHFDSEADLQRYEALLEMADLGVHHQSLPELFVALAERLSRVAAADAAHFALYDPVKNVLRGHFWEKSGFSAVQAERLVDESPPDGHGRTNNRLLSLIWPRIRDFHLC